MSDTQVDRISMLEAQFRQMQLRLTELEFKMGTEMASGWIHAHDTDEFVEEEKTPIKLKQLNTFEQTKTLLTDTNYKSVT